MSVLFAILLFSLLIFVHELGHFAAVCLMNSGTPVSAFMIVCDLIPPFFLPIFGFRPAPFRTFENSDMVVESITYSFCAHS